MDVATPQPRHDEDMASGKRKPREKKPRHKFSLLYTIPAAVLNEAEVTSLGGGRTKRGKRQGFVMYDALVCKSCRPPRLFHARSAMRLHAAEEHDLRREERAAASSLARRPPRTRRSAAAAAVECIDLESDEELGHDDDDDIEILSKDEDESIVSLIRNPFFSVKMLRSLQRMKAGMDLMMTFSRWMQIQVFQMPGGILIINSCIDIKTETC